MRRRFLLVFVASVLLLSGWGSFGVQASADNDTRTLSVNASGDPVIGAVGDMACDPADPKFQGGGGTAIRCAESRTSSTMLADTSLTAILGLGDYQYDCGDQADYAVSYNPTWGRLDPLMQPVAGNHEYKTGTDVFGTPCPTANTTAQSYFDHFGAAAHQTTGGHFSVDLGTWHLIALNGNCSKTGVGGCSATSRQTTWLKTDLAATTQPCILAYWHQPLFTGSSSVSGTAYRPWWDALYAARADVVLNGHLHNYQRYAPLSPTGAADSVMGITEYVVGTGGESFASVNSGVSPQPVVWRKTFGYLRLVLHPLGWDSAFIDSTGAVLDTATGTCH
jgi:hypothetical protein